MVPNLSKSETKNSLPTHGAYYIDYCSNHSPLACSSARPPEAEMKQARHVVRVDTWLCEHRLYESDLDRCIFER